MGFYFGFLFLALDFCRFCMTIRFFHPHNGQWPTTSKGFLSQILPITFFFPILILEKEPVFPFLMLSGKQGYYWYHFYNVFGMTQSLSGIEPGTSYTWSQHSTTRLSRRRCKLIVDLGQNYISKIKKLIISMI